VWDLTTMTVARRFPGVTGMARPYALSPDGNWLAGKVGAKVRICDETGRPTTLALPEGRADWFDFAGPDRLLTLRFNEPGRGIEVWDLKSQKIAFSLPFPEGCNGSLAVVSPDGKYLAMPRSNQLVLLELQENAKPRSVELPKARQGAGCRRLAIAHDGSEVSGLYEQVFVGFHILSWDLKTGASNREHLVPNGCFADFFYREGPPIEWLPEKKGWMLYGQAVIDSQKGGLAGAIPLDNQLSPHVIRVLTSQYAVEYTGTELTIIAMPKPKGN